MLVLEIISLFTSVVDPDTVPDSTKSGFDLNWLGPVVTAFGGVIVAAIGGVSIAWRRSQDRKDDIEDTASAHQPTITDGWEEVRQARQEATRYYNLYRGFETAFYTVSTALRRLVRSTRAAHPEYVFEDEIREALAVIPPDPTKTK